MEEDGLPTGNRAKEKIPAGFGKEVKSVAGEKQNAKPLHPGRLTWNLMAWTFGRLLSSTTRRGFQVLC